MPINFDPNSLNSVFDKNFGAGAYNAGLSNAANAARLKQMANFAKSDALKRVQALQAKAKKDQEYMDKYGMTYDQYQAKKEQDKLNKLQDQQVLDNGLASDQMQKMRDKAKSEGRGGSQPSYDQQRKEAQQNAKNSNDLTSYDTSKMTPHNQELVNKMIADKNKVDQQQQQKKSSPSLLNKIGNGLKGIGNEIGAAATAAEQFINPFDKVSADQAVKNYMNRNQSQGFQEVARGANRAVDSASLGLMSNLDKKLNNRDAYYNSQRAFGQGGGTDMITSGLGFLVPGVGTAKRVKALGLGAKSIPTLEKGAGLMANLARGSQVARTVAKEGALVGGALPLAQMGINYAINPKGQNLKDNLANVALGAGLGAVGDPILRGLGSVGGNVLAKFAKGDIPTFTGKPSQATLDALTPKLQQGLNSFRELEQKPFKANISNLPLNPTKGIENIKPFDGYLPKQASKDVSNSPLFMSLNPAKTAEKMNPKPNLTPVEQQYQNELNQAVQQQVDYLKNSMGKGVDHGTTSNGQPGNFKEVTGTYSVSNNPKWYQDFYKQNGRKPNNAELEQLAKEHVLGGFQDEYGNIPAFVPKKIQDINDQIDQAMTIIKQKPEQAPVLKPYLDALSQEKAQAEQEYNQLLMKLNLQQFGKNTPKSTNISPNPIKNEKISNSSEQLNIDPKKRADQLIAQYKQNPMKDLPDTSKQISSKTIKENIPFKLKAVNAKDKAYIQGFDNLHRLNQFTQQARAINGKILPENDPYMLGLGTRNADQIAHFITNEKMVDHMGNTVGESLGNIGKDLPKGQHQAFDEYLVAKHAIARMDRGETVYSKDLAMTPEKAAAKAAELETKFPHFKQLADRYYKFNNNLTEKWLVDRGMLDKKTYEGYKKSNPYYVSNERKFSDMEKSNQIQKAGKGFANQSKQIKKATGSERQIIDPIETSIERVDRYVKASKRNEVMQAFINNLKQDPQSFEGIAEFVPTKDIPENLKFDLQKTLQEKGTDGFVEEFTKLFDQKPDLTKGNIVRAFVDGKPVYLRIHDPEMLDALTNLGPKSLGEVIQAIGKATRMMKTLTTGVNPMFSLLRNIWKDIPQSYINSKTLNNAFNLKNLYTFHKDLISALVDITRNRDAWKSFKAFGGGHASPISSDINLLAKSKRRLLPNDTVGFKQKANRLLEKGMSGIETFSNAVESAPRLAEYKRIAKNGDYNSKIKGLYEANDITVNFNRYGNIAKQVDQIIPYFNAAMQGMDKIARVFKDNPFQATAKTMIGVTIPSALSFAWNYKNDYEGYKNLPPYVRDSNLLFSLGDGKFVKIPMPRELAVFGTVPIRLFQSWADQDPNAFEGFGNSLLNIFFPPTRLINAPLNDIRANKDFANRPIVPNDLANLSPRYQYDEKTSTPAKLIGGLINQSPKQIDYLGKSYLGIIGQLGIPATSQGSNLGDTLKNQLVVDTAYSNNSTNRFYDLKTKLQTANNDYKSTGIQGKYYNPALLKQFNSITSQISKVRKQITSTQDNTSLNNSQKKTQLRLLQQQINKLAEMGNNSAGGLR